MKRGGQHAVINWIESGIEGSKLFLNDVTLNHDPFLTFNDLNGYRSNRLLINASPGIMGRLCRKDLLIYNFEDPMIDQIYEYGRDIGKSDQEFNVLILRDAYNLFASRLAGLGIFMKESRVSPVLKEIWKSHAREFINDTSFIANKVCVSYNSFIESAEYRKNLELTLGLRDPEFSNRAATAGGGSSFDPGPTVDLSSLNTRFLKCLEEPLYQNLFRNDHELFELNMRIFGEFLGPHEDMLRQLI
jgi:hypothetical protein